MKINTDVRALNTDTSPAQKTTGNPAVKTTSATPAIGGGSVNISEASRALQSAGASHVEAPFDAKRVEAIKSAISSGHFKVDPERIADKVLDSASQLLVGS